MASRLFDLPVPILALISSASDPSPRSHTSIVWTILAVIILVVFGWRSYANSEDRKLLLYKGGASLGLIFLMLVLLFIGQRNPKVALLFILPAVIFSFVWLPNLVTFFLRPITGAFDGGYDEEEAKPFYFIASAKRIKGLHQEAIAEIHKQLETFPGDVAGMMLLATIQAEDLHDLPAAKTTVDELLEQPELKPQEVATALHTLADWQLQHGRDSAAARASLEKIVQMLPNTQFSHAAEQRLAHLDEIVATREFRENARFEVRPRERDIGIRPTPGFEPQAADPEEMAAEYVRQLEKFPSDTTTREKLAVLYAEHYGRVDLAADQLEQLIALPDETPKHVARWLNLLATLHIGIAKDEAAARAAVKRIIERFPNGAHADLATTRLGNLRSELKSAAATAAKSIGVYEKDLGLKKPEV